MNKRLLKRLFLNNWIPKIASLLAAIALWFLINGYQKNDAVMGDPVGENRN
jgi:YbbR domain-containing protein